MLNPIQKVGQSSTFFEKPGILHKKFETLTCSNYSTVQLFFGNFAHVSYLPMSTKGCASFFYFVKILSYLQKFEKAWYLHTRFLQFH